MMACRRRGGLSSERERKVKKRPLGSYKRVRETHKFNRNTRVMSLKKGILENIDELLKKSTVQCKQETLVYDCHMISYALLSCEVFLRTMTC